MLKTLGFTKQQSIRVAADFARARRGKKIRVGALTLNIIDSPPPFVPRAQKLKIKIQGEEKTIGIAHNAPVNSASPRKPRLGMIVPKKALRRAHDRNRAKRLVREAFRHHQALIPNNTDWVMVVSKYPDEAAFKADLQAMLMKALHQNSLANLPVSPPY